ncbi:3-hydroxy-3-methylglutaryl CoA synthase [Erythrobacter sp. HI0063]|uniref:hydroxymethylglutaryl-CoA synthase family protein n=1 Tax=Erythrobacter sp. HI0063 TaxID=1822240 RepID=UPI0007C2483B|nr:3-oxoacyl-[acyl-carrier-protein] synthase III C-terminal domain-containing protein [Erythrobacter sp. HI0063]KZY57209.1 3-hydroxy-3-methylglutaryl CoA synthase [Erythrobacter sp. HI0063]
MIGITGYGAYLPRLRMRRQAIAEANAWYAPNIRGKGTRTLANWDEDVVTMAVAAARDCLGRGDDRGNIAALMLASTTLPFAERLNGAIVARALTLDRSVAASDVGGSQRAGLTALQHALDAVAAGRGDALVLSADARRARPGSGSELAFGDGAAALTIGSEGVLAQFLGSASESVDFVDRFRLAGEPFDYVWEERWVRDEGMSKMMPGVIGAALADAGIDPGSVDHFIMPSTLRNIDAQVAKAVGIPADAVVPTLFERIGECGTAHALILCAKVLETAKPGELIVLGQFGSGAQAMVFRVTDEVGAVRPLRGVSGWMARGVEEDRYTKFLSFKGEIALERGMRGEQDQKTALSTAYRHEDALLGFVAGRCEVTGEVSFPPSRIIYAEGQPLKDTQRPYGLAERPAKVLSWSAEYLSFHRSPPHCYGQIDFDGGGRVLMEFTDVDPDAIDSGMDVEMTFRIKAIDETRGYRRYFWKATSARPAQEEH